MRESSSEESVVSVVGLFNIVIVFKLFVGIVWFMEGKPLSEVSGLEDGSTFRLGPFEGPFVGSFLIKLKFGTNISDIAVYRHS